jgi:hypothetical protein
MSRREACSRHPWAISLIVSRSKPGAATLKHHNGVIRFLRAAGFSIYMPLTRCPRTPWRMRASRGEDGKLVTNLVLHGKVEADPAKKYSPEQIAGRLKVDFPDQREMQVSTETIYQSLYVQSRGALKRDLTSLWLGVNQDGPGRADLSDRRRLLQEVEVSV